ncbi:hypothetical protein MUG78_16695, partial [Gordonia alkaliphila]|uniref:hypothetical protein n=1 Tax=Gordonia alkaliphila TaxID=1053547 RepID=UPI001FF179C2
MNNPYSACVLPHCVRIIRVLLPALAPGCLVLLGPLAVPITGVRQGWLVNPEWGWCFRARIARRAMFSGPLNPTTTEAL